MGKVALRNEIERHAGCVKAARKEFERVSLKFSQEPSAENGMQLTHALYTLNTRWELMKETQAELAELEARLPKRSVSNGSRKQSG